MSRLDRSGFTEEQKQDMADEIVTIPARLLLDLIRTAERWPDLLSSLEPPEQTGARSALCNQAPYTYAMLVDLDAFGDVEAWEEAHAARDSRRPA
jgi:hypothetical protein